MRARHAIFLALSGVVASSGLVHAQQIRGRVVDEPSRRGIGDLMVMVLAQDNTLVGNVSTDAQGFFQARTGPGRFTIVVQGIGYAPARRAVAVGSSDLTIPAFVLDIDAVELDSVSATARRAPAVAPVGFARSAHILAAEKLADLERRGVTLLHALRQFNGLHIRQMRDETGHNRVCVEARRAIQPLRPETLATRSRLRRNVQQIRCEWIVVVIDGLVSSDPEPILRAQGLTDYESVEFASPVDAGMRWGMEASSRGALVLWSRGRGPHVDASRNIR